MKDFTKRWKDKTECSEGYKTTDCKNGPKATPTPTAPATDPTQQVPTDPSQGTVPTPTDGWSSTVAEFHGNAAHEAAFPV